MGFGSITSKSFGKILGDFVQSDKNDQLNLMPAMPCYSTRS